MGDLNNKSFAELGQEYTNLCVKAGDLQFRIDAMSKDLSLLNKAMQDVQAAGALAQKREAEAAAAAKPASVEGEAPNA